MSLMTHTIPLRVREFAHAKNNADGGTLASSHVAMIKRFAKFALMVTGFFLLMVAVMSVKFVAFYPQFARFVH
jgi:hypothetical protein